MKRNESIDIGETDDERITLRLVLSKENDITYVTA